MIELLAGPAAQVAGSLMNFVSQERTNKSNMDQAMYNREFQREMSNTAHQREMKDKLDAGLNPNLATTSSGASTPAGDSATMQAPQIQLPDMMSYGISLKQLENADRQLDQVDRKTLLDYMKHDIDSKYTKAKTHNERYGWNRVMSTFFKGMLNEDKSSVSSDMLFQGAKKLLKNIKGSGRKVPELGNDHHDQNKYPALKLR